MTNDFAGTVETVDSDSAILYFSIVEETSLNPRPKWEPLIFNFPVIFTTLPVIASNEAVLSDALNTTVKFPSSAVTL